MNQSIGAHPLPDLPEIARNHALLLRSHPPYCGALPAQEVERKAAGGAAGGVVGSHLAH